jgi:hypothetical protein
VDDIPDYYFYLETELVTAKRLLSIGFDEIDKLGYRNSFINAALVLLSSGLERLLKTLVLIDYFARGCSPVKKRELCRKFFGGTGGHDIRKLQKEVVNIIEAKDYVKGFDGGEETLSFIKDDALLRDLVGLLTVFAKGGRYYNLDKIMGKSKGKHGPNTAWANLEMMVISGSNRLLVLSREEKREELFKEVSKEFKRTLVRFADGVTWLFALGEFGEIGEYLKPILVNYTNPHNRVLYE